MSTELVALAAAAASGLVPYLVEGGKEIAKSTAKDLYGWIKAKLGPDAGSLAKLQASPGDPRRRDALAADIEDVLKAQPVAAAELRRLVEALPPAGSMQVANVHGDGNTVAQIAGSNNRVGR